MTKKETTKTATPPQSKTPSPTAPKKSTPLVGVCSLPGAGTPPIGRPSTKTDETIDVLCGLLMEGKTLVQICQTEGMPAYRTVCRWLGEDEAFRQKYAHAREVQADYFADETIGIADTDPDPAIARLRIDARKWHASKTAPKKYGDKITQELTGADGANLSIQVCFGD